MNFDVNALSRHPACVETGMREVCRKAVPLRTVVVYCCDSRAVNIPQTVRRAMPGEVYRGEVLRDARGMRVASTAAILPVVVASGRAVDTLRSITVAQHVFGMDNIVVVHQKRSGTTSFTVDGLVAAFRTEEGVEISTLYDR